jgi:hypothetical protein
MRTRISAAAVAVGLTTAGLFVALPADADTGGCVTLQEFHKVERTWAKHRVHRVFDTRGKLDARVRSWQNRAYPTCAGNASSEVELDFFRDDGRWWLARKSIHIRS